VTIARSIARPIASPIASRTPIIGGGGGVPPGPTNLIANGTFASDTVWSKGLGWAIAGGVCTRSSVASGSLLSQLITVTPGVTYQITFDIVAITGGTLNARFFGGTSVIGASSGVVGQYTTTLTAAAGNTSFAIGASAGSVACEIDNVVVVPV